MKNNEIVNVEERSRNIKRTNCVKAGKLPNIVRENFEVVCPYCNGDFNHIVSVATKIDPTGDENKLIQGVSIVLETGKLQRRAALQIEFYCEDCNSFWYAILQQKKGHLEVELAQGQKVIGDIRRWIGNDIKS